MRRESWQRAAAGVLALLCAGVAATCGARGVHSVAPATPASSGAGTARRPVLPATSGDALQPQTASSSGVAQMAVGPAAAAGGRASLHLPRFCSALHRLEQQQGAEHVRVLWFGDSHTYADFLTHAVRTPLQQRFGNGGPGYLHLGIDRYRHGGIKATVQGKWRLEPESPSRSSRWGDGVFGLGGLRAVPVGAHASTEASLLPGAAPGPVEYVLWFRLPRASAGFAVQVDDGQPQTIDGIKQRTDTVASVRLDGSAGGRLRLSRFRGEPQLFGVVVETQKPGVVLDTLGINGARAATPLSWDETAWVPLVAARKPALVVLAYGTNEVFADMDPERYAAHYRGLMGRIRRAQSNADCLLLGPTDVPEEGGGTQPRVLAIDAVQRRVAVELRCAFVSLHETMGGTGGFGRWAQHDPPWAARDHVHLTPNGYGHLGQLVAERILTACR